MRVKDHMDNGAFRKLLNEAEREALTDWETKFVAEMIERFDEWGEDCFLSEPQLEALEKITSGDKTGELF